MSGKKKLKLDDSMVPLHDQVLKYNENDCFFDNPNDWKLVKINGQYELLGSGSFGCVFAIAPLLHKDNLRDKSKKAPLDLSQKRAMKVIRASNMDMRAFTSEVNLQQILAESCKYIVPIEDFSNITLPSKEIAYVARMPILTPVVTSDNSNVIFGRKELEYKDLKDTKEILRLAYDIGTALSILHNLNIEQIGCEALIHCDVKLENFMYNEENDCYQLGDFGVVAIKKTGQANKTTRGSNGYMAPEIAHGEKYDQRVDIYSLGIALYLLLNEMRWPVTNDSYLSLNSSNLWKRYEAEEIEKPPNGTSRLKELVVKACQNNPENRYQTMNDFLSDLEAATAEYEGMMKGNGSEENTVNAPYMEDTSKKENEESEDTDSIYIDIGSIPDPLEYSLHKGPSEKSESGSKSEVKKDTTDKKEPEVKKDTAEKKEPEVKKDTADKKEPEVKKDTADKKEPQVKKDTAGKKEPQVKKDTTGKKDTVRKIPAVLLLSLTAFFMEFSFWNETMAVHLTAAIMAVILLIFAFMCWSRDDGSKHFPYPMIFIMVAVTAAAFMLRLSPVLAAILIIAFFILPPAFMAAVSGAVLSGFFLTVFAALPSMEFLFRFQTSAAPLAVILLGAACYLFSKSSAKDGSCTGLFYGVCIFVSGVVCRILQTVFKVSIPAWVTAMHLIRSGVAFVIVSLLIMIIAFSVSKDSRGKNQ